MSVFCPPDRPCEMLPRRLRARPPWHVALAAAAALLLHALVLTGLPTASTTATGATPRPPMTVHARVPAPPVSARSTGGAGPPPAQPVPTVVAQAADGPRRPPGRGLERTAPTGVEPMPDASAPAPAPTPAADRTGHDAVATAAPLPEPLQASLGAPATSVAFGGPGEEQVPVPVYATRLAPAQTLAYVLRRGPSTGEAVLDWRVEGQAEPGAAYRLTMLARVAGVAWMTQTSQGRVDAEGLVPQRFTDRRLRGTQAANFQRERGLISFSGPTVEHPWQPGVQDRLSWMLQLPAIVDATPALAAPGQAITVAVVGARGDASVWTFRFEAVDPVATSTGEVAALKFVRLPRRPHDTQAEVWLDPAHHHLPVRVRIGNPPEGEVLELLRAGP